jgi:hypothetical protein
MEFALYCDEKIVRFTYLAPKARSVKINVGA